MNDLRRLAYIIYPFRWKLIFAGVLVVTTGSTRLILPLGLQQIVDMVLTRKDVGLVCQLALGLFILVLCKHAISLGHDLLMTHVQLRVDARVQIMLYQKLLGFDLDFFSERRVGEIMSRLTHDAASIQLLLTGKLIGIISDILIFVGAVGVTFYLNPRLALLMFLTVPPVVLTSRFFGNRLRNIYTELQDRAADVSAELEETLGSMRLIKSFVREPFQSKRYVEVIEASIAAQLRSVYLGMWYSPLMTLIGYVGLGTVMGFGAYQLMVGQHSPGELVSFIYYFKIISGSISSFAGMYKGLQEQLGTLRRVFELLDTQPTVVDPPHGVVFRTVKGHVRFEQVSFAYDGPLVLRGVNLEVVPGEVVALVGPSGAGKTTLVSLIPRFYDPTSGVITIDGVDSRSVTLSSLREQIGIVHQETQLFRRTVRENILFGRSDATEREMIAAAEAANVHGFISMLPDGYDTPLGERGVKLSGGERQRVALARTILKNPRILLLDEATSSLDSKSEALVQEALRRLMQGRTTFIIAHRLATVRIADRIVVLDKGRIVEQGSHGELLARGGLYAHLYSLQFGFGVTTSTILPVHAEPVAAPSI